MSLAEKGQPSKAHLYYKKRVQDCLAMEKRLLNLKAQLQEYQIPLEDHPISDLHSSHADVVEAARAELDHLERELVESVSFLRENRAAIARLTERRQVLNAVRGGMIADVMRRSAGGTASMVGGDDFSGAASDDEAEEEKKAVDVAGDSDRLHIRNVLVGTIATDQQIGFSRMLYRVSRGNAFARFKEISLPAPVKAADGAKEEEAAEEKSVFYAVVLGEQITARVTRMCDAFKVNLYQVPESGQEIKAQVEKIRQDLKDKRDVEARTEVSVSALLSRLGSSDETGTTPLRDWQAAIAVERQIATTLMKAHFYLTMISLEGWVPATELTAIKQACKQAVSGTGNPPAAIEVDPANPIRIPAQPPTYFRLNKFTETFQGIVDTYGVPRYKEANPGLFTVISFPFLFGVMYGDIGHGIALTLFALTLVYKEDALLALQKRGQLGEIPAMAVGGRYVLLLMGLFAVYCGMIYNDCFSIPINAWGSNYYDPGANYTQLNFTTSVYPIGVDPAWPHKANSLAFANSMKMKMAVTLGVTQMLFGICLSLSNHLYFHDYLARCTSSSSRAWSSCSPPSATWCFMILLKWCGTLHTHTHTQPPPLLLLPELTHPQTPPSSPPNPSRHLLSWPVRRGASTGLTSSTPPPNLIQTMIADVPQLRVQWTPTSSCTPARPASRSSSSSAAVFSVPCPPLCQAVRAQEGARQEGRRLPVRGARIDPQLTHDSHDGRRRRTTRSSACRRPSRPVSRSTLDVDAVHASEVTTSCTRSSPSAMR